MGKTIKDNKIIKKLKEKRTLKFMLIVYLVIFLISIAVLHYSKDQGINKLYNYIDDNCYNNEELKNNSYSINTDYTIMKIIPKYNKYHCIVSVTGEEMNYGK